MTPALLNNRYRIIKPLGAGGFGETFLAEDTQMPSSRRCVIKQLKPVANNPQIYQLVRDRFAREAAILEELGEGNSQIPRLYAYFSEGDGFYLVQEWVDGETLSQKLETSGVMSESSVRAFLVSVLPVLEFVHSKRIVHRDIKPDNIIVRRRDGVPVLIDFGAVKETMGTVVNSQGNATSSIVIGTPGFMPSEQAAGRPLYSSDLYSLGLTAIYLLTGKWPQELADPVAGEFVWHRHASRVSPELAAVLDKATQFNPRQRYTAAREMLDALQQPLQQPTVPVSPTVPSGVPVSRSLEVPISAPSGGGDWQKAAIVGGIVGACVIIGLAITRPQPNSPPRESDAGSFYFLADSAFRDQNNAESRLQTLKSSGYREASQFWIPDYPNLSGSPLWQVYVAKFPDSASCAEMLRDYQQKKPDAYCDLASKERSAPAGRLQAGEAGSPPSQASSKPSPEQAVRDYYAMINSRNYQTGWGKLSGKFQSKYSENSYEAYAGWWEKVQQVDIRQVTLVESGGDSATVDAAIAYLMKDGRVIPDSIRIQLVWDAQTGSWLFDDRIKKSG
ncbi:serine/threonine-protein kinase [Kamptonema formosum]|uniref:serine/threonine-protein kinase n=1 Tax=Kamptonema formosum TaxID=331992 RepID=UPI00037617A9|nr:serine/threonine-protein kinase [Oscillatoria sp. PCC 10802]